MCIQQALAAALCDRHAADEAYRAFSELCGGYSEVFTFNDTHSHAEVVALFDRTIELLRRRANSAARAA